jgi:RNA polymerase sigma-70 factor, ECF subfamily
MPAAVRQVALAAYNRQGRRAGNRPAVFMEGWHNYVDWAGLIDAVAKRRDREAFGELFSHFAPRVKGMLIKLGTAPELADDLAQETMLTVWRKAEQFDPSTTAVAAWIYTIARNLRIDAARKQRASTPFAEAEYESWEDPAPQPDKILEAQQDFTRVRKALAALPADQADAIRSAYYLDLSQTDIADALDAPLGTVKSRMRLALKRLRALLDGDNAD